jgi:hypothetical protein
LINLDQVEDKDKQLIEMVGRSVLHDHKICGMSKLSKTKSLLIFVKIVDVHIVETLRKVLFKATAQILMRSNRRKFNATKEIEVIKIKVIRDIVTRDQPLYKNSV